MRRLLGRHQRTTREQLPPAGVAGGWRVDHDDRRARAGRRGASRRAARVHHARRRAMRHLHARHGACRRHAARTLPESHRRGHPRWTRRQPLPVHRLYAHLRSRAPGPSSGAPSGVVYVRAYLPAYDLRAPETLHDAVSLMAASPGAWRPFAGGTDLMVLLEAGKLPEGRYLGLWKLRDLTGIEVRDDAVVLGALTTYTEVLRHSSEAR